MRMGRIPLRSARTDGQPRRAGLCGAPTRPRDFRSAVGPAAVCPVPPPQVMRKQLEEPAKDKDAASYDTRVRVAARAFAAQAGQSSETLLPALSHLVQRFLCAVLSYIHTGKHEHALQHARGYLCIMREAGAQALQDGRIVAMMTTCFPNLRNPAALLGHYYYRLLYTGLEKVHGKKEAEGYAKDMGATTAAVACFMVTAVTRQLVTVEAVVGALGDVLEVRAPSRPS